MWLKTGWWCVTWGWGDDSESIEQIIWCGIIYGPSISIQVVCHLRTDDLLTYFASAGDLEVAESKKSPSKLDGHTSPATALVMIWKTLGNIAVPMPPRVFTYLTISWKEYRITFDQNFPESHVRFLSVNRFILERLVANISTSILFNFSSPLSLHGWPNAKRKVMSSTVSSWAFIDTCQNQQGIIRLSLLIGSYSEIWCYLV